MSTLEWTMASNMRARAWCYNIIRHAIAKHPAVSDDLLPVSAAALRSAASSQFLQQKQTRCRFRVNSISFLPRSPAGRGFASDEESLRSGRAYDWPHQHCLRIPRWPARKLSWDWLTTVQTHKDRMSTWISDRDYNFNSSIVQRSRLYNISSILKFLKPMIYSIHLSNVPYNRWIFDFWFFHLYLTFPHSHVNAWFHQYSTP